MSNELLQQILNELKTIKTDIRDLKQGQTNLKADVKDLKQGQQDIKDELKYIWSDIKRLDNRLSHQEQETFILKRMK